MTGFDTEFNDDVVCPWCGAVQRDIFEIGGVYEEGESRTSCDECDEEFAIETHVTFRFTTNRVDVEAERREREAEAARWREEREQQRAACAKFPPGTRVRVRTRWPRSREWIEGVVSNRELSTVVHVESDCADHPWSNTFLPEDVEAL